MLVFEKLPDGTRRWVEKLHPAPDATVPVTVMVPEYVIKEARPYLEAGMTRSVEDYLAARLDQRTPGQRRLPGECEEIRAYLKERYGFDPDGQVP